MLSWRDCPNCDATVDATLGVCDRCGEDIKAPGTGRPRFSAEARDAGVEMGGLLKLYPAAGARVRYVGWCPGGAIGIDAAGQLVWVANWAYMGSVEVDGAKLRFEGRPADIETGKVLDLPQKS